MHLFVLCECIKRLMNVWQSVPCPLVTVKATLGKVNSKQISTHLELALTVHFTLSQETATAAWKSLAAWRPETTGCCGDVTQVTLTVQWRSVLQVGTISLPNSTFDIFPTQTLSWWQICIWNYTPLAHHVFHWGSITVETFYNSWV